jgi:hypothetical protein
VLCDDGPVVDGMERDDDENERDVEDRLGYDKSGVRFA